MLNIASSARNVINYSLCLQSSFIWVDALYFEMFTKHPCIVNVLVVEVFLADDVNAFVASRYYTRNNY